MENLEWKPIKVLSPQDIVENWFETKDGKRLSMPIYYGNLIDLENMRYVVKNWDDKQYETPRLQDLVIDGTLSLKHIYGDDCRLVLGNIRSLSTDRIKKIQNYFKKECGINVTKKAIQHNYCSWLCDYKSGYRDEKNGYHLFSPCGCNPFSLTITKLPKEMEIEWQKTYQC